MYILYALLGAVMASLGTIFAKLGLKEVDANLLTAIKWLFVVLSGLGGALSWLFFYQALATGPIVAVTVIDKLSIVLTAILATVILMEGITLQIGIGLALVFIGTILVAVPWEKIESLF